MATVTIRNMRHLVENRIEFKGNSVFAEADSGLYVVYSYGRHFPMFVHDAGTDQWYENSDKYSVTTSKHQSTCRPLYVETIKLDTDGMQRLIEFAKYLAKRCANRVPRHATSEEDIR